MTVRARKRARPGRGSLMTIAGFLILSAALRLGMGASEVLAREQAEIEQGTAREAVGASCEQPPDVQALLDAFKERETRLLAKETAIKERAHALKITNEAVLQKMEELKAAEEKLRETIALAESASENDLTRLTAVYETMKPKEAAELFEQMDPEFAAGFLGRMTPEAAAGVMAGLSPQSAYSISVILAGRNALVPTE